MAAWLSTLRHLPRTGAESKILGTVNCSAEKLQHYFNFGTLFFFISIGCVVIVGKVVVPRTNRSSHSLGREGQRLRGSLDL